MRIAIFSDVHGNTIALDAVLADIQAQGGADEYWVLGDLAALGYDPRGALERIFSLPNARLIHGNTDRYVYAPEPLPLDELRANLELLPRVLTNRQDFAWTRGALAYTDWLQILTALPLEIRQTLPDGTRVLCVHASPGTDDGIGVQPRVSSEQLQTLFKGCDQDLVFVGHTHWAMEVMVNHTRVVNLGSVSLQNPPDLRAKYVMLHADASGHRVERRFVDYDHAAVITKLETLRSPAYELLIHYMRGEQKAQWSKNLSAAEARQLGLPDVLIDPSA